MLKWLRKRELSELTLELPREEILRRSRILVIDDERPDLIEDLKSGKFYVDYVPDVEASNQELLENGMFDLILLDFGDVGRRFGEDEGLALMKHVKRVNPAIIILAYTSRALESSQADFFRLADGVLPKDAGIQESMERIEEGLREAHSLENVWSGLLRVAGITPSSPQDTELQDLFVRGLNSTRKMADFKNRITHALSTEIVVQNVGQALLAKLVELAVKSSIG